MKDAASQTIYLSNYKPPAFLVDDVHLTFQLDPRKTRVISRISFYPNPQSDEHKFTLHGEDLTLMSAKIDGKDCDVSVENGILTAAAPNKPFVWEAEVEISPQTNTALEGLYMSNGMYSTQCEAEGFRKITYYPDRPDVMSRFHVRIEDSSGSLPVLLSNGNPVASGDGWAEWHDPWPKPAYLFALVAGDLVNHPGQFTTASGRDVTLNIWVRPGDEDKCSFAMQALIASMRWDEQVYGREYDLDLFNIVAVDDFNAGAMENKGLNIFNSSCVLANPATSTDADFEMIEAIIAHEYFHNWTGNRITCRDWFQLCLKEGLTVFRDAQFTADMRSAPVKRIQDANGLRNYQFPEDNGPLAHPVRPDSFVEINNFYTATVYEKGAEVIRMLAGFLGKDGFRKGMDLYFARHDGHAVTCDDFLAAMADANNVNLDGFQGWYQQAGTPQLRVRRHAGDDASHLLLSLSQQIPDTAAQTPRNALPISLRLAFLDQQGKIVPTRLAADAAAQDEHVILLTEEHLEQRIYAPQAANLTPSILRNFSAPVVVDDDLSPDERRHIMRYDTDLFNRWDSAQTLVSDEILAIAADPQAAVNSDRIAALADGVSHILDDPNCLDYFKAAIVTLPAISVLESRMTPADPVALFNARLAFEAALAQQLHGHYQAALDPKKSAQLADTAGGRALLNRLLALAVAAGDAQADERAMAHVLDSNMTVSQGALAAVNNRPTVVRESVLSAFHDRWQDNALVLEKWFSFESMSCISGRIERLQELMQHPAFDPKNPNKLRVVLGAFMSGNPVRFYAEDGSGFEFIAGCLIDIDKRNPQLAARMALPLTRIGAYSEQRHQQMRTVLKTVQAAAQSNDLSEVIDKALV